MNAKYDIVAPDNQKSLYDSERLYRLIMKIFLTLSERDQKILQLRFGINEITSMSVEEVGQHFFVTKNRIRQMEAKAIMRLRSRIREELKFRDLKVLADDIGSEYIGEMTLLIYEKKGENNYNDLMNFDVDEIEENTTREKLSNENPYELEEILPTDELLKLSNRT